jgi:hypothetical protein
MPAPSGSVLWRVLFDQPRPLRHPRFPLLLPPVRRPVQPIKRRQAGSFVPAAYPLREPQKCEGRYSAHYLLAAKGTPSLSASAALNRRAVRSSLIKRASSFAASNGSVPSITILISRPERRSHTGTDSTCCIMPCPSKSSTRSRLLPMADDAAQRGGAGRAASI